MPYIGNIPASIGNYRIVDDISSTFNGVLTTFPLTVLALAINPPKSPQLLISVNGVLQEPDDTGASGFLVSGSNVVFSSPPATGATFWGVWQGQAVDIGTPSDGTVDSSQLAVGVQAELDGKVATTDIGTTVLSPTGDGSGLTGLQSTLVAGTDYLAPTGDGSGLTGIETTNDLDGGAANTTYSVADIILEGGGA